MSPQVGSVHGGTVVTITGTGFKVEELEWIEVDIDGIPCRVCEQQYSGGVVTRVARVLISTTSKQLFLNNSE